GSRDRAVAGSADLPSRLIHSAGPRAAIDSMLRSNRIVGAARATSRRASMRCRAASGFRNALEAGRSWCAMREMTRERAPVSRRARGMEVRIMKGKELTAKQKEALLETLQARFEANPQRHEGIAWSKVRAKLEASPKKLWSLSEMER